MDIQSRKISFIQDFLTIQSEELITRLENLLKKEKEQYLKAMSIEELQNRINLSLEDSKNDRIISNDDLTAEIKNW